MKDLVRFARALEFAAIKHADQRRKGKREEPYVNHVAAVAKLVADATGGRDTNVVIAALLHDTLEDTNTRYVDLVRHFGKDVANLVREVTDNKRLHKKVRKRLQVEHAPHKSPRAKLIKIADKTSNLQSILESPPVDWTRKRKREYFEWARAVVEGCRGVNRKLEAEFDAIYSRAVSRGIASPVQLA